MKPLLFRALRAPGSPERRAQPLAALLLLLLLLLEVSNAGRIPVVDVLV